MRIPATLLLPLVLLPVCPTVIHAGAQAPGGSWLDSAQTLERRADWVSLLELGQQWTRAEGENPLAWFVLGRAYGAMGRHAEAVEAYRRDLMLAPDDSYAYNNLGNSYLALGRNREAMDAYRHAVRVEPGYLLAWKNLGQAFYRLKGHAGLTQALDKIQAADPDLAQAWRRLATAYALSGDARAAQMAMDTLGGLDAKKRERLFDLLLEGI